MTILNKDFGVITYTSNHTDTDSNYMVYSVCLFYQYLPRWRWPCMMGKKRYTWNVHMESRVYSCFHCLSASQMLSMVWYSLIPCAQQMLSMMLKVKTNMPRCCFLAPQNILTKSNVFRDLSKNWRCSCEIWVEYRHP